MSELYPATMERKLYYDGPNYTADAVIIDPEAAQIRLIQRAVTGEWALPGGFIDPTDESSCQAAIREAWEETGIGLTGDAPLIFRGIVDDPRNSDTSWIETSAYYFNVPHTTRGNAGDDAQATDWFSIGDLPPLYASHQQIVEHALDYIESEKLFALMDSPEATIPVEGGFMKYDKFIVEKDNRLAFIKQRPTEHTISPGRYEEMRDYLVKEAGIMSHLRQNGFKHLPAKSAFRGETLIMDAIRPEDGWRWQADQTVIDAYLKDTLAAFSELETIPLPNDSFNVAPSYESVIEEGWQAFTQDTYDRLMARYPEFMAHLPNSMQETAVKLINDVPALKDMANLAPEPERFVFCHLDIRQENLAWHPESGVKIIDWSWAGPGLPGSDSTSLLIDLHKNGYDINQYLSHISPRHCLNMLGFWLMRSTLPNQGAEGLREQQFLSAVNAYELLKKVG